MWLKTNILRLNAGNGFNTVATLLQAHTEGWAFECLGPSVPLELEPTRCGLIIQCGRYLNGQKRKQYILNQDTQHPFTPEYFLPNISFSQKTTQ